MRPSVFVFSFILIIAVFLSCNQLTYDEDVIVNEYEVFGNKLSEAKAKGVFVDDIIYKDNRRIEVFFSNNQHFIVKGDDMQLLTIGVDGFWYKNGVRSSYLVENNTISDIIGQIDGDSGVMYALSEGYEDWTFHFTDHPSITILKTIYSKDFDRSLLSINHRGFSVFAPENTLPAFRLARLKGFRYVETDIRFTIDNIPVLLHDDSIDRTSNGTGKICELSFSQVREYDFGDWKSSEFKGTRIPSLDEFLSLCKNTGLHPVLEIKVANKEQINQIIDSVERMGLAEETIYISFSPSVLGKVLERQPTAIVAFLTSIVDEDAIKTIRSFNALTVPIMNSNDYSDEAIARCREFSIPLWVWVINDKDTIFSLSSYVTAVTSDRIHAGRMKEMGR